MALKHTIFDNPQTAASADVTDALFALADGHFTRVRVVGHSVCGRPLCALELGNLCAPALIIGGTHALEWISVLVCLRLCRTLCEHLRANITIYGIDLREALRERGAVIVPLVNPDGYDLHRLGPQSLARRAGLLSRFSREQLAAWQANANGVDLNRNWNAGFWRAQKTVDAMGIHGPAPTRYGGPWPCSEHENRALCRLCDKLRPRTLYSLHAQGEEIYWQYGAQPPFGSDYIASLLASLTGYALCSPDPVAADAGFKDWFIKRYFRPAFTIELGLGKNPLPYDCLDPVWEQVRRALVVASVV